VLLLETMLGFRDKETLLRAVATALFPCGRFAFTVEEGRPLSEAERAAMPSPDTVWPVPLTELVGLLSSAGLEVRWIRECSRSHRVVAGALADAFLHERSAIEAELGEGVLHDLLVAHRLWHDWLGTGRARKFAVVAVKTDAPHGVGERRRRCLRSNS